MQLSKEKGFTLVELVISIFILSVAIMGIYSSFAAMVVATAGISNRLIAANLAQEGVEIVRNIRDNNWISGTRAWNYGLVNCTTGCQADYRTGLNGEVNFIQWAQGEEEGNFLNIKQVNGRTFYAYDSNYPESNFKRKITITFPPLRGEAGQVMLVTVEVFWKEKPSLLFPQERYGSLKAEDALYNWY